MDAQEKAAARRLAETFSAEMLDSLITDAVKSGTPIGTKGITVGQILGQQRTGA